MSVQFLTFIMSGTSGIRHWQSKMGFGNKIKDDPACSKRTYLYLMVGMVGKLSDPLS